jgi:hypothetical protein
VALADSIDPAVAELLEGRSASGEFLQVVTTALRGA